jgi:hypothetical protein
MSLMTSALLVNMAFYLGSFHSTWITVVFWLFLGLGGPVTFGVTIWLWLKGWGVHYRKLVQVGSAVLGFSACVALIIHQGDALTQGSLNERKANWSAGGKTTLIVKDSPRDYNNFRSGFWFGMFYFWIPLCMKTVLKASFGLCVTVCVGFATVIIMTLPHFDWEMSHVGMIALVVCLFGVETAIFFIDERGHRLGFNTQLSFFRLQTYCISKLSASLSAAQIDADLYRAELADLDYCSPGDRPHVLFSDASGGTVQRRT